MLFSSAFRRTAAQGACMCVFPLGVGFGLWVACVCPCWRASGGRWHGHGTGTSLRRRRGSCDLRGRQSCNGISWRRSRWVRSHTPLRFVSGCRRRAWTLTPSLPLSPHTHLNTGARRVAGAARPMSTAAAGNNVYRTLYQNVFKSNIAYLTYVFAGAIALEWVYSKGIDAAWEISNSGVRADRAMGR